MAKKGYKSQRNQAEIYEEVKQPTSLGLTPTAKDILRIFSSTQEISQSEFIERLLREIKSASSRISCSDDPPKYQQKLTISVTFVQS
jgi:DNA-binding MarR family transcriptional regulator